MKFWRALKLAQETPGVKIQRPGTGIISVWHVTTPAEGDAPASHAAVLCVATHADTDNPSAEPWLPRPEDLLASDWEQL